MTGTDARMSIARSSSLPCAPMASTRAYGGVTYYFCNPGCADKFAQNPAAYLG